MIHAGLRVSGMDFLYDYAILFTIGLKNDQDINFIHIRRWSSSSHFSLRDILLFTPSEHLLDRILLI